jgi:prepilin-type N-terminal cleavage/methylation domain-containing protein
MLIKRVIGFKSAQSGFSTIELMVALSLFAVVSVAAIQFVSQNEISLLEGRNDLTNQQKNAAIASYIYDDFRRDNLADSVQSPIYTNSTMPQDLQDAPPLVISTIFGNGSRYNAIDPKCRLAAYADIPNKMVFFDSSCESAAGYSIVENINVVLRQGAKVVFALEGGGGRCTLSTPITVSSRSSYVRAFVDDPSCLRQGSNPSSAVTPGKQIIFPRYVAFSRDNPASFYTSMIEPLDKSAPGLTVEMPSLFTSISSVLTALENIEVFALDTRSQLDLKINTSHSTKRLRFLAIPSGMTVTGDNTSTVTFGGSPTQIASALSNLQYQSDNGFFGDDILTLHARAGTISRTASSTIKVTANCGGVANGTETRFDLGRYNAATRTFDVNEFVTIVSVWSNIYPQDYYGYCGPDPADSSRFVRFDPTDGTPTYYPASPEPCQRPLDASASAPGAYIRYSPRNRDETSESITVFLHEQHTLNTADRFSLFFVFDDNDPTGGRVNFSLNNIEPNRNLTSFADRFTFADDPHEYRPQTIGSDGTPTSVPQWTNAHDGLVLPLRLPSTGKRDGQYELEFYNQDPDGDGDVNPRLTMNVAQGLNKWNIRAVNPSGVGVSYRQFNLQDNQDIQMRISESQRCPTP